MGLLEKSHLLISSNANHKRNEDVSFNETPHGPYRDHIVFMVWYFQAGKDKTVRISPWELMISSLVLLKEANYAEAEEKVKMMTI